jgi:hypothetical protein
LPVLQPVGVRTYSSAYVPMVAGGGSLGFDLAIEKAISSERCSARSSSNLDKRGIGDGYKTCARKRLVQATQTRFIVG